VDFRHEGRPSACQDITTGFFRSKGNVDSTPISRLPQAEQAAASGHGLVIRIAMQRIVKRLGLFEFREIERGEDVSAVFIPFLCHAVDVDPGSGRMPVTERLLSLAQGSRSLRRHPREGVARPVQIEGFRTHSVVCAAPSYPPRPARLATSVANSSGSTGFGTCAW